MFKLQKVDKHSRNSQIEEFYQKSMTFWCSIFQLSLIYSGPPPPPTPSHKFCTMKICVPPREWIMGNWSNWEIENRLINMTIKTRSRDGAVVRALASHQCGLGSIPDPASYVGWICCWFSTLLREVFLRVLRLSSLFKNQHFQIPIRSWNARTFLNEFLWTP